MALRKPTTDNTAATTAATASPFESETETNSDTATAVADEVVEAAAPAPAAAAPTTTEVTPVAARPAHPVVVANNSALANALRRNTGLDDAQGVIAIETLETMGVGAFPRITVDQGGFSRNKNEFLGAWIKVEVLSWNFVTLVTCSEKDDKDADKLIRSSYDGVNIPGDATTVDEYITKLKVMGYEKANAKKYVEIYANLLATDKKGDNEDPPMVQISVSPQSVKQWHRFLLESKMKAFKNKEVSNTVLIGFERTVNGSNTYGVMQFGIKL